MKEAEQKSEVFNLSGSRRLLNEIDKMNSEETGDYYLESLRVTHGGPNNSITYFQIIGWDDGDRKESLEVSFEKGVLRTNENFKRYASQEVP